MIRNVSKEFELHQETRGPNVSKNNFIAFESLVKTKPFALYFVTFRIQYFSHLVVFPGLSEDGCRGGGLCLAIRSDLKRVQYVGSNLSGGNT